MPADHDPLAQDKREIVSVARRILNGSSGIIAGAREITRVRFTSHSIEKDQELLVFGGIASETDHLPVGDARKHWSAEALAAKDAEIKSAETFFTERALRAAKILINRYDEAAPSKSSQSLPP